MMNTKQDTFTVHRRARGAVHKGSNSKAILVWFPSEVVTALDQAVITQDTDRSKFIRRAVRAHLASLEPVAAK